MFENPATIATLISIVGSVAGLGWFMSRQLSQIKDFVYSSSEDVRRSMVEKLEYHERHDDKRFSDIVDDIWELRLKYAAIEGLVLQPTRIRQKPKVDTK